MFRRTPENTDLPWKGHVMSEKCVRMEVTDKVALVTLDRPPVNALNRDMRYQLVALFDEISARDDIMCAVLTGNGNVFCAGADLKDRPNNDIPGLSLIHISEPTRPY